jgi:DsbC/DsbD-like thiol-disulfide interchange protein
MMHRLTLLFCQGACLLACLAGCARPASSGFGNHEGSKTPIATQHKRSTDVEMEQVSEGIANVEIELEEPASYNPFVARAALVPADVEVPRTLTFIIRAKTAPGWHVYAADGPVGISQPTRLDLQLPRGVEPDGDWVYPEPTQGDGGNGAQLVYEGDLVFRRRLKITDAASSGGLSVGCEITYQACDAFSCRPPENLKLEAVADAVQVP